MKVSDNRVVKYSEVDAGFRLRLSWACRWFQEVAGRHAEQAGEPLREMRESGFAWILHRLAVRVMRLPELERAVEVVTWSRGIRDFKAFRDFVVQANGEPLLLGSSVWVHINHREGRVVRPGPDVATRYTTEPDCALPEDLDRWRPDARLAETVALPLATRACDFDSNGHLNNATYVDLVETALWRATGTPAVLRDLRIQFDRGIPPVQDTVTVGLAPAGSGWKFRLHAGDTVFARGDCGGTDAP